MPKKTISALKRANIRSPAQLDAIPLRDLKLIDGFGPSAYQAVRDARGIVTTAQVKRETVHEGVVTSILELEYQEDNAETNEQRNEEMSNPFDFGFEEPTEEPVVEQGNVVPFQPQEPKVVAPVGNDDPNTFVVTLQPRFATWLRNAAKNLFDKDPEWLIDKLVREAKQHDQTDGGLQKGRATISGQQIDVG